MTKSTTNKKKKKKKKKIRETRWQCSALIQGRCDSALGQPANKEDDENWSDSGGN